MPISYTVDREQRILFSTWIGKITADDLRRHWATAFADPEALAIGRSLADVREASPALTGDEMAELVREIAAPRLAGRTWTVALLVAKPAQYGVSRQYQVFAEQFSRDSIFYDRDEAVRWLLAR